MKEKHIKQYKILGFAFLFLILPLFTYTIQISGNQNSQIIGSKDFDEKRDILPKSSYWDDYVDDHISGGVGSTMNFERMTQNNELYATLEEEYISGIDLWLLSQTYRFNDINYFHGVEYLCIDVSSIAFNAPLDVYGGLSTSSMHYMGQISFPGETDFYIIDWLTGSPFYVKLLSTTEEDKGPYYIKRMHIVYDGAITPPGTPVLNQPTTPDYDGDIDLSWSRAGDEAGYRIYRNTIHVGTVGAGVTSWTDNDLIANTYTYYIQAYNDGGTSNSNEEIVVVSAPGNPTLEQPISPDIDGTIDLSWSNVVGENGYYVQRRDNGVGSFSTKETIGADITSWTDIGVPEGDYEYRIKAFNTIGTTDSNIVSVEVGYYQLCWLTPESGNIEFGPEPGPDTARFNFSFHANDLDIIELWINDTYYEDVTSHPTYVDLPYSENINGSVKAVLRGKLEGSYVAEDTRYFIFKKIINKFTILVDSGIEFIDNMLYLILYDPNGDRSWSGLTESSKYSILTGSTITNSSGFNIGVDTSDNLYGDISGTGTNTEFHIENTELSSFDKKLTTVDTLSITSTTTWEAVPNNTGPGYGDAYWGEVWSFSWECKALETEYWGGIIKYSDPTIYYGIRMESEALLSDAMAPEEWRAQNYVHQGFPDSANITWLGNETVAGGGLDIDRSHKILSNTYRNYKLETRIGGELAVKVFGVSLTCYIDFKTLAYTDEEWEYCTTRRYHMEDFDVGDVIVNDVGVDNRFGTYIFRTISDSCFTSDPLEYNTQDYRPPEIDFPEITLDTSGDEIGPCCDDEPLVVVKIEDESGIQESTIKFTVDNGEHWHSTALTEQIANPGFWEGKLPAYGRGTNVQWYIRARDNFNMIMERKNQWDEPWIYTVQNLDPIITVVSPNGGEEFEDVVTIEWDAADVDDDDLTFTLAYNIANTGWNLLASNITRSTYVWNVSSLGYNPSITIIVIVNDGYGGETEDQSDFCFTINASNIPQEISGYSYIALISIMFVTIVSIVVIFKRKKFQNQ